MFHLSSALLDSDVLILVSGHSLEPLERLMEHGHPLRPVHHHALSTSVHQESLARRTEGKPACTLIYMRGCGRLWIA